MDQKMLEMIEDARRTDPHLDKLVQTHSNLNEQVDSLNSQTFRTEEETQKLSELKKEKLRIRDMIQQSVQMAQSA